MRPISNKERVLKQKVNSLKKVFRNLPYMVNGGSVMIESHNGTLKTTVRVNLTKE